MVAEAEAELGEADLALETRTQVSQQNFKVKREEELLQRLKQKLNNKEEMTQELLLIFMVFQM